MLCLSCTGVCVCSHAHGNIVVEYLFLLLSVLSPWDRLSPKPGARSFASYTGWPESASGPVALWSLPFPSTQPCSAFYQSAGDQNPGPQVLQGMDALTHRTLFPVPQPWFLWKTNLLLNKDFAYNLIFTFSPSFLRSSFQYFATGSC